MARKHKSFRKKNKALPIAIMAPIAMPAVQYVLPKAMHGDFKGALQSVAQEYAGIEPNGQFRAQQIMEWAVPTMIGVVVHKGANKFGVNRYFRKMSMGYLEL